MHSTESFSLINSGHFGLAKQNSLIREVRKFPLNGIFLHKSSSALIRPNRKPTFLATYCMRHLSTANISIVSFLFLRPAHQLSIFNFIYWSSGYFFDARDWNELPAGFRANSLQWMQIPVRINAILLSLVTYFLCWSSLYETSCHFTTGLQNFQLWWLFLFAQKKSQLKICYLLH